MATKKEIVNPVPVKTPPYRLIALLVLLLVVLGLFWYKTNTWPIAALVNGKPVWRFTLDQQLYNQGGQQVLDSMITQRLVQDELDKNHITSTSAEVDQRINDIKTSLGSSFDSALAAQGMTMDQLKTQVGTQIKIEKLLSDKATVSAAEIDDMVKQQKTDASSAAKLLKQQKLQALIQTWVADLKAKAKIVIVGSKQSVAVPAPSAGN